MNKRQRKKYKKKYTNKSFAAHYMNVAREQMKVMRELMESK